MGTSGARLLGIVIALCLFVVSQDAQVIVVPDSMNVDPPRLGASFNSRRGSLQLVTPS